MTTENIDNKQSFNAKELSMNEKFITWYELDGSIRGYEVPAKVMIDWLHWHSGEIESFLNNHHANHKARREASKALKGY